MRKELDEALCRDFPLLFTDRYTDMKETCMIWGFACSDGWYSIIREAAEKIEPLIQRFIEENAALDPTQYPRASQVKEKYGTLRFYMSSGTEEIFNIINNVEEKSETICETCGDEGTLRGVGWLYTACLEHTRKEDLENMLERYKENYNEVDKKLDKVIAFLLKNGKVSVTELKELTGYSEYTLNEMLNENGD